MRKGILLAGGTGTRLYPLTIIANKHLLPVFDKPMIYYSLSVLMLANIRDILLISTAEDVPNFQRLFGDGSHLGISIDYAVQDEPRGIAEALLIGEKFIGDQPVALMLGDNILFGVGLGKRLQNIGESDNAHIFAYRVSDPERYGVIETDADGRIVSIEEKPEKPKSNFAITGLYFYPSDAADFARNIKPSARGELEITDVNNAYLKSGRLEVETLSRGYAWLDAGTETALLDSGNFIAAIEKRQNLRIGCIEEVAWQMGWIDDSQLLTLAEKFGSSAYGQYIRSVVLEKI
jgi:glucose-1-phosphate thymidylyltransferase